MSINLVLGHINDSLEIKVLYFKIINVCINKHNYKIKQLKYNEIQLTDDIKL